MQSCKMKTLKEHIIRWIPAVMGLFVCASCQKSDETLPVAPTDDGQLLSMVLRVPSNASQEGQYEPGSTYENYIDMSADGYRIYFFDKNDNTLIARFETAEVVPVEGKDFVDYTLLGKVPETLVSHPDFKIVILANWPRYADDALTVGTTGITDICNADWAQFNCPTDFNLGPDNLIPFYGVHTYEGVTFKPGMATLLNEPITLLRAMAKVEVILETDDYFNLAFDRVWINRYNKTGYCAPDADSEDDYDHNGNWDEDYAESLHLVTGSETGTDLPLLKVSREEGAANAAGDKTITEKWIAYLPEYDNKNAGDDYACIKAKFNIQVENDNPHTIYFAEYSNGESANTDRLDIERNNLYRFHVKCTGYNYKLTLSVVDWFGSFDNVFEYGDGQVVSPVAPWDDEHDNNYEF